MANRIVVIVLLTMFANSMLHFLFVKVTTILLMFVSQQPLCSVQRKNHKMCLFSVICGMSTCMNVTCCNLPLTCRSITSLYGRCSLRVDRDEASVLRSVTLLKSSVLASPANASCARCVVPRTENETITRLLSVELKRGRRFRSHTHVDTKV